MQIVPRSLDIFTDTALASVPLPSRPTPATTLPIFALITDHPAMIPPKHKGE
jgi:hypothetical protein